MGLTFGNIRKKLRTWEVNFGYLEQGEKKNALVKCRLCFECSYKLNYHHKRKELTKKKKKKKKKRKKRSRSSSTSGESDSDNRSRKRKAVEDKLEKEKAEKVEAELEKAASNLWSKPAEKEEEKSREEVFDEFLGDLFL